MSKRESKILHIIVITWHLSEISNSGYERHVNFNDSSNLDVSLESHHFVGATFFLILMMETAITISAVKFCAHQERTIKLCILIYNLSSRKCDVLRKEWDQNFGVCIGDRKAPSPPMAGSSSTLLDFHVIVAFYVKVNKYTPHLCVNTWGMCVCNASLNLDVSLDSQYIITERGTILRRLQHPWLSHKLFY